MEHRKRMPHRMKASYGKSGNDALKGHRSGMVETMIEKVNNCVVLL